MQGYGRQVHESPRVVLGPAMIKLSPYALKSTDVTLSIDHWQSPFSNSCISIGGADIGHQLVPGCTNIQNLKRKQPK